MSTCASLSRYAYARGRRWMPPENSCAVRRLFPSEALGFSTSADNIQAYDRHVGQAIHAYPCNILMDHKDCKGLMVQLCWNGLKSPKRHDASGLKAAEVVKPVEALHDLRRCEACRCACHASDSSGCIGSDTFIVMTLQKNTNDARIIKDRWFWLIL